MPSQYEPEDLFRHRPTISRSLSIEEMDQVIADAMSGVVLMAFCAPQSFKSAVPSALPRLSLGFPQFAVVGSF